MGPCSRSGCVGLPDWVLVLLAWPSGVCGGLDAGIKVLPFCTPVRKIGRLGPSLGTPFLQPGPAKLSPLKWRPAAPDDLQYAPNNTQRHPHSQKQRKHWMISQSSILEPLLCYVAMYAHTHFCHTLKSTTDPKNTTPRTSGEQLLMKSGNLHETPLYAYGMNMGPSLGTPFLQPGPAKLSP